MADINSNTDLTKEIEGCSEDIERRRNHYETTVRTTYAPFEYVPPPTKDITVTAYVPYDKFDNEDIPEYVDKVVIVGESRGGILVTPPEDYSKKDECELRQMADDAKKRVFDENNEMAKSNLESVEKTHTTVIPEDWEHERAKNLLGEFGRFKDVFCDGDNNDDDVYIKQAEMQLQTQVTEEAKKLADKWEKTPGPLAANSVEGTSSLIFQSVLEMKKEKERLFEVLQEKDREKQRAQEAYDHMCLDLGDACNHETITLCKLDDNKVNCRSKPVSYRCVTCDMKIMGMDPGLLHEYGFDDY